jgi:hypothetical protein
MIAGRPQLLIGQLRRRVTEVFDVLAMWGLLQVLIVVWFAHLGRD